jgi:hypothetical protein
VPARLDSIPNVGTLSKRYTERYLSRLHKRSLLRRLALTLSRLSGSRAVAQAICRGDPGSSPHQVMWDLWWSEQNWGRFSLANSHSTDCSTLIIYHPRVVR